MTQARGSARRTLQDVCGVTYCVDALAPSRDAWVKELGYLLTHQGEISAAMAQAWQAPAAEGLPYCLLQPPSGDGFWIRYIETGERRGFESPATRGWMATELLVKDPDALAAKLANSAFQHLAGPGDLFPGPKSPRAMQMIGPAGELLYFTRILPGGSRFGMKQARSPVDRAFILTIAGDSTESMRRFYAEQLNMRVMDPLPFINGILAHSCGAPPDTIFPTSLSPIPGRRFLIELDEFPSGLPARPVSDGQLPPGLALVSFRVNNLEQVTLPPLAAASAIPTAPYQGRSVAVIRGAADEMLELIEGETQ